MQETLLSLINSLDLRKHSAIKVLTNFKRCVTIFDILIAHKADFNDT